jgi:hypothetical protein
MALDGEDLRDGSGRGGRGAELDHGVDGVSRGTAEQGEPWWERRDVVAVLRISRNGVLVLTICSTNCSGEQSPSQVWSLTILSSPPCPLTSPVHQYLPSRVNSFPYTPTSQPFSPRTHSPPMAMEMIWCPKQIPTSLTWRVSGDVPTWRTNSISGGINGLATSCAVCSDGQQHRRGCLPT